MPIDFPTTPTVGQVYTYAGVTYVFTSTGIWSTAGAGAVAAVGAQAPQGRLTLQSATPVMTTTQAAKTAIYYTPYIGNQIVLFNGTTLVSTTFTELTVATTDTVNSPAAIGASKVNDWFVWDSGGGTLRLVHGPDWTNDTTRSAAVVKINGIWLNAVAITNGPAIQRGTYVGTTRSNASSQLDWIIGTTGSATTGVAGFFGIWNAYNRVDVASMVGDGTANWTYNLNAWRSVNNSSTNRHSFVSGLAEDGIWAQYQVVATASTTNAQIGIALDATNALAASCTTGAMFGNSLLNMAASLSVGPQLGFHFVQAIENNSGANGTNTFFSNGTSPVYQAGLHFKFRM